MCEGYQNRGQHTSNFVLRGTYVGPRRRTLAEPYLSARVAPGRRDLSPRAAILGNAGQLFNDHAPELDESIVRESGGIQPKADLPTYPY